LKKTLILVSLGLLLVLAWTNSCKSIFSSDESSSSATAETSASNNSNSNNSNSNSGSGTTTGMGFLQVIIRDAPVTNVDQVWITIDRIRVHQACETEDTCFITVLETPMYVDLLLMKDSPLDLTPVPLPAGKYNQIRMSVGSPCSLVLKGDDPTPYPLDVPSDEIKIHYQFEVPEGGTAQITLDFNAEESLHIVKKGNKDVYLLRPVVNVVGFQQQGPGI